MKEKKKNLILIIIVVVINLSLVGLLIYGIVQRNIKSDTEQPNDSNPPETITPSNSDTDADETEGIVPPITPSDPSDKTEESEKADIEFDIDDYKPVPKDPTVEDVEIEYGTKEVDTNA